MPGQHFFMTQRFPFVDSISWGFRVDFARPLFDAASHGLYVVPAFTSQPRCYGERTRAVVAKYDNMGIGVEFVVGSRRNFVHGDVGAAGDGGSGYLPWLAHVEE